MKKITVFVKAMLVISIVAELSFISVKIWSEKPETRARSGEILYNKDMTVAEFGKKNNLPDSLPKKIMNLETGKDLKKKLKDFNYSQQEITAKIKKEMILQTEHESKNFKKIFIKFSLWIIFLIAVFFTLQKIKLTNKLRIILYTFAVVLFGVMLGSDPGPMGTIKDAIVLLGSEGVIFPPRIIALFIFLLMVFIANKFICSWGCQAGTLQDLLFRINRNKKDKPIIKQFKIHFFISNGIRIAFFIVFTMAAFLWAFDIVEIIDPFKIFKPGKLSIIGWIFISAIFFASIFVYRPWCHLFCPFGLAGWLVEKISIYKISVNYEKCIACEACSKACPSTVMDSILKRDRIIADCFACASCIEACPVNAIEFKKGKRAIPSAKKFKH